MLVTRSCLLEAQLESEKELLELPELEDWKPPELELDEFHWEVEPPPDVQLPEELDSSDFERIPDRLEEPPALLFLDL